MTARVRTRSVVLVAAVLVIAGLIQTSRHRSAPQVGTRTLIVYGFSILGEVMNQGIFPAFAATWQHKTGERVELLGGFGGSGTITNQILLGAPADVAILAHELDAIRLRDAGVLKTDWRMFPHGGVISRTPFIIVTRAGNPLSIRGFEDLARPALRLVHPDPLTSGGALWAVLAEYGSVTMRGGSPDEATKQLRGIWRNVRYQAASVRAVRTQFEAGFGDALVTSEQETLSKPIRGEVIYPTATILSEHVAVVVDRNVGPDQQEVVRAFMEFLWSAEGQKIFVKFGFRSVDDALNRDAAKFPRLAQAFTVADLGGWSAAKAAIIDSVWRDKVLSEVHP